LAASGDLASNADSHAPITLKRQHVVIVLYSRVVGSNPDVTLSARLPILDQLQTLSDAMSTQSLTLIPYRVANGLWTIAPETKLILDPDVAKRSRTTTDPSTLMDELLAHLSKDTVKALGARDGTPLSALPQDSKQKIIAALSPPFQIVETGIARMPIRVVANQTQAPDWDTLRLRACMRMDPTAFMMTINGVKQCPFRPALAPRGLELRTEGGLDWLSVGGEPQPMVRIPNRLGSVPNGPSTLAPIGISGRLELTKVIQQLRKVTGFSLYANRRFYSDEVFINDPATTAREVMQCLALALEATWRSLGTDYILSWGDRGIRSAQVWASEALDKVRQKTNLADQVQANMPAWAWMVDSLPFADDDPFPLTDSQRAQLFGSGQAQSNELHYDDLVPAQRQFLEARIYHVPQGATKPEGLIDEQAVQSITIGALAHVDLFVYFPSSGWVRLPNGLYGIVSNSVRSIRNHLVNKPEQAAAAPPTTVQTQAKTRAAMIGRIRCSQMPDLLRSLARHGITQVFYPILHDGYSSITSAYFPLDPSYGGAEGWSSISRLASQDGIRLTGYIDVLSWRGETDQYHWLNKHPDWRDVDVLNRTTLDWRRENPDMMSFGWFEGAVPSVYVRPTEPEVQRRLRGLVGELAKRKEVTSIAFADWEAPGNDAMSLFQTLGYSVPDRLKSLHEQGEDPVDVPIQPNFLNARDLDALLVTSVIHAASPLVTTTPYLALLNALVAHAKRARHDWTTYVVDDRSIAYRTGPTPEKSNGDVILTGGSTGPFASVPNIVVHLWPASQDGVLTPGRKPARLPILVSDDIIQICKVKPLDSLVYDFRDAMGDIDRSLAALPTIAHNGPTRVIH
jgi:hypothetical protein